MTSIDTTRALEIGYSPLRFVLMLSGFLAFIVIAYAMTRASHGTSRYSLETVHLAGYVGIVFFGLCLLLAFARLLLERGPIVTLSPMGIRDVRISHDFIPWHAVSAIRTKTYNRQEMMILTLRLSVMANLKLSPIARYTRSLTQTFSADGLVIAPNGLKIRNDDLMAATLAYAYAHRRA